MNFILFTCVRHEYEILNLCMLAYTKGSHHVSIYQTMKYRNMKVPPQAAEEPHNLFDQIILSAAQVGSSPHIVFSVYSSSSP